MFKQFKRKQSRQDRPVELTLKVDTLIQQTEQLYGSQDFVIRAIDEAYAHVFSSTIKNPEHHGQSLLESRFNALVDTV
jgi:hypothetical protein